MNENQKLNENCEKCGNPIEYNNIGSWCFPCTIQGVLEHINKGYCANDIYHSPDEVDQLVLVEFGKIKELLEKVKY